MTIVSRLKKYNTRIRKSRAYKAVNAEYRDAKPYLIKGGQFAYTGGKKVAIGTYNFLEKATRPEESAPYRRRRYHKYYSGTSAPYYVRKTTRRYRSRRRSNNPLEGLF